MRHLITSTELALMTWKGVMFPPTASRCLPMVRKRLQQGPKLKSLEKNLLTMIMLLMLSHMRPRKKRQEGTIMSPRKVCLNMTMFLNLMKKTYQNQQSSEYSRRVQTGIVMFLWAVKMSGVMFLRRWPE